MTGIGGSAVAACFAASRLGRVTLFSHYRTTPAWRLVTPLTAGYTPSVTPHTLYDTVRYDTIR